MTAATEARKVEAQAAQREESKRATLDVMKGKKRAEVEFPLYLDGDELTIKYRAIGAREYDKLVAKHPPSKAEEAEGAVFNINTFAPALISAVSLDPKMTEEDAEEIWNSPDWSRGDLMTLFRNAIDLNNRGLDVPFSARG